jgi:hypothetical protein
MSGFSQSERAKCIRFLLGMIPPVDLNVWSLSAQTMFAVWSRLLKERGRHAKARVHALIRTFHAIRHHSGETMGEYVMHLSRLV